LSSDGNTLAVGAPHEGSIATGIDGDQTDNSAVDAGAAYLYTRSGTVWAQQAYIKASNTETGILGGFGWVNDKFGESLALSSDGNTLAVSAWYDDSNATRIDGDQADNSASISGAAYLY